MYHSVTSPAFSWAVPLFFKHLNRSLHKIDYYLIYSRYEFQQFFHYALHIWSSSLPNCKLTFFQKYFNAVLPVDITIWNVMFANSSLISRNRSVVISPNINYHYTDSKIKSIDTSIKLTFPSRAHWWNQRGYMKLSPCRRPVQYKTNLTWLE